MAGLAGADRVGVAREANLINVKVADPPYRVGISEDGTVLGREKTKKQLALVSDVLGALDAVMKAHVQKCTSKTAKGAGFRGSVIALYVEGRIMGLARANKPSHSGYSIVLGGPDTDGRPLHSLPPALGGVPAQAPPAHHGISYDRKNGRSGAPNIRPKRPVPEPLPAPRPPGFPKGPVRSGLYGATIWSTYYGIKFVTGAGWENVDVQSKNIWPW